jgi:tetratricopeptide (TPR) repeat protein
MLDRNSAGPFHAMNAVFMGITACASFAFLSLPGFRIALLPAVTGALLFAVHPAISSTVHPIVGRETLMVACFTIASVYAFAKGGERWFTVSMILLACALLSKEQAVVIPLLFLLADACGISRDAPGTSFRKWIQRHRTPVIVLVAYLGLRWTQFSGSEYRLNVLQNPADVLLSIRFTIQTIFAPYTELMYEPAVDAWYSTWRFSVGCVAVGLLISAVYRFRPVHTRAAIFWTGWVLVCIAPTANIIEQQAPYSERYVVLAVFAAIAMTAGVLSSVQTSLNRPGLAIGAVILLVISGSVTLGRGQYFATQMAFAQQWAKTNPRFAETQMSLGTEFYLSGQFAKAATCFRTGMDLESSNSSVCRNWLAKMQLVQGHFEEASELLRTSSGEKFSCLLNGVALQGSDDLAAATDSFEQALRIDRSFFAAHFLLAENLRTSGETDRAATHAQIAAAAPVLDLSFAAITNEQLRSIARFPELRMLVLKNTNVTDSDFTWARDFRKLERFWIPGTTVTDTGIAYLRGSETINSLVISNTQVTDACVESLISIPHLNHLDIRYTNISEAGIRKLKEQLPDCQIFH